MVMVLETLVMIGVGMITVVIDVEMMVVGKVSVVRTLEEGVMVEVVNITGKEDESVIAVK